MEINKYMLNHMNLESLKLEICTVLSKKKKKRKEEKKKIE